MPHRPFILIASLRRTGSTVIAEALTLLPHCFIFREPRLGMNRFKVKPDDREFFQRHGVDLDVLAPRQRNRSPARVLDTFRDELLPRLDGVVRQVGVKEIRLTGWTEYSRAFPDIRIILTGRDPRDIYISLYERVANGTANWKGRFSPEALAEELDFEFHHQLDMFSRFQCLKVRYEDLCTDATILKRIKTFTECDVPDGSGVGHFNASKSNRREEFELHGTSITSKRVGRCSTTADLRLVTGAERMLRLMPEYVRFWRYPWNVGCEKK